jgi:hypothetical protein
VVSTVLIWAVLVLVDLVLVVLTSSVLVLVVLIMASRFGKRWQHNTMIETMFFEDCSCA